MRLKFSIQYILHFQNTSTNTQREQAEDKLVMKNEINDYKSVKSSYHHSAALGLCKLIAIQKYMQYKSLLWCEYMIWSSCFIELLKRWNAEVKAQITYKQKSAPLGSVALRAG